MIVSPSHTVRLMAMKTALGKVRSTQDHTEEHQNHCSGTLSRESSAQISCLVWWEDLNSASSCLKHSSGNSTYGAKSKQFSEERKREASPKLLPNLGLSWTGQRLNKHL